MEGGDEMPQGIGFRIDPIADFNLVHFANGRQCVQFRIALISHFTAIGTIRIRNTMCQCRGTSGNLGKNNGKLFSHHRIRRTHQKGMSKPAVASGIAQALDQFRI